MAQIINYQLDITGLQLSYEKNGEKFGLQVAPLPTCELLKETKVIKDFTADENGEPVIIQATGQHYWFEFVSLFKLDTHTPLLIAEHHYKHLKPTFIL